MAQLMGQDLSLPIPILNGDENKKPVIAPGNVSKADHSFEHIHRKQYCFGKQASHQRRRFTYF